jgi:hypothetical protein
LIKELENGNVLFTCPDCNKSIEMSRKRAAHYRKDGALCKECKVGYESSKYRSLYNRWFGMIDRCYNEKSNSYPSYGAVGVTVCDEWRNDKNTFFEWAKKNGYQKDLDLDKDIKSRKLGIYPPIYSPETCMFIPSRTNSKVTRKLISSNTTGYRGVSFDSRSNSYVANISNNNKAIYIKKSRYAIECALAYDKYIDDNNFIHTKNNIAKIEIDRFENFKNKKKELRNNLIKLSKEKRDFSLLQKKYDKKIKYLEEQIKKDKNYILLADKEYTTEICL